MSLMLDALKRIEAKQTSVACAGVPACRQAGRIGNLSPRRSSPIAPPSAALCRRRRIELPPPASADDRDQA